MLVLTSIYIPHNNIQRFYFEPAYPPSEDWCREWAVALIRNDQSRIGNARSRPAASVAQFTYLRMLGAPSAVELDHPEESCQLYSQIDPVQGLDLYDLLLHEPASAKKPSVLYDYSPPLPALLPEAERGGEIFSGMKRSPNSSQTEACVRKCTCSKTRCQKNYCECFKQGVACSSACECVSCGNREKLFSQRSSGDGRGCNCQKSRCQKNYCECHLNGKRCGPACKCTHCANTDLPEDCLDLGTAARPSKRRKGYDSL